MFLIKLKRTFKNDFDEILEFDQENKANNVYWQVMKENYFYGALSKSSNGRENNIASFCNGKFANRNTNDNYNKN